MRENWADVNHVPFPVSLDFTYFTKCKETLQFVLFKKCITCIE